MTSVAETLRPLVETWLPAGPSIGIRCWDGSQLGPTDSKATLVVRSPRALRYLVWSPDEIGLGRAYVAGDLDIEGDIYAALELRAALDEGDTVDLRLGVRGLGRAVAAARRLGALGRPPAPPPEEARLRGRRHSKARDAAAIAHHYDVSNDFYRLVLGPTMTYSCGYFPHADTSLDEAQWAKYELICRKLGVGPGTRLLDVGSGWGGMALHAARHHGARVVGVTLSRRQVEWATRWAEEEGLAARVEFRLQDYRDVDDGPYDTISSIGMFEHVGLDRLAEYFGNLFSLLRPEGRLLNHAISRPPGGDPALHDKSFIGRYVFPDGALHEVGSVVTAMQEPGFEVRDVESLREHYARTLRHWVANLEGHWDEVVRLVGLGRAKVWRIYMAASALNFEENRTQIHHVLGVRTTPEGASGVPPTREEWLGLGGSVPDA